MIFWHYLKNNEKINMKSFFSTESKEQHQNLKRTEIISHMRGSPPRNTSLFTLKYFLAISTIYSTAFVI